VTCCALCSKFYRARRRPVSHCFGVGYRCSTRRGRPPGCVLNSRAVHQGQPSIKRGLCLSLVGALELISAADWNILISLLNLGLVDSRVSTSSRACFQIPTWTPNRITFRHSKSWRRSTGVRVRSNQRQLETFSESIFLIAERDVLRKMVLLRRSGVGAVSAGSLSGGAVCGLCFGG
jgi:hypothetical protein